MKNLLFSLVILWFSCIPVLGKELVLCQKLQLKQTTKVSEINAQLDNYLGKRIHIKPKGGWTYLADAYAILLRILAMTGMLMIRAKNKARGLILTFIGFLIPITYLLIAL